MTRHVQLLLLLVGVAANGVKEDAKYEPIFRRVLLREGVIGRWATEFS